MIDGDIQARLARLCADVRAVLAPHGVTDTALPAAGSRPAEVATEPQVREALPV